MRLAIMQPYFLPYIGYFQLISAVDQFVLYDNIKYTKKGWINRNRILRNGKDVIFTLPLQQDSDTLDVCERKLAINFNCKKLLNQFKEAYHLAPYFEQIFPLLEAIVRYEDVNLFRYLHHSIIKICNYMQINTKILTSSDIDIDHGLKSQEKVLAFCAATNAGVYVNSIGGFKLYDARAFRDKGLSLNFIRSKKIEYAQWGAPFIPWLSIIDVMMFNAQEEISLIIKDGYELICGETNE